MHHLKFHAQHVALAPMPSHVNVKINLRMRGMCRDTRDPVDLFWAWLNLSCIPLQVSYKELRRLEIICSHYTKGKQLKTRNAMMILWLHLVWILCCQRMAAGQTEYQGTSVHACTIIDNCATVMINGL